MQPRDNWAEIKEDVPSLEGFKTRLGLEQPGLLKAALAHGRVLE